MAKANATSKDGNSLSLPVLKSPGKHGSWAGGGGVVKTSRAAKWRAWVLIGVHVAILIHIAQWLITGITVSPVEPSESMATLREGVVNTGFVLFALAMLSTIIFGRYFCGWACHVIALQDLSSWILKKFGIRPKPFRSRLLVYVPVCAALYMFVWPVFHRFVIAPIFEDETGRLPPWLGQSLTPEAMTTEFLVTDYWATFPDWYVAIPFLLVCGFGAVYFLGSKGYCTYGCPYGGFFGPLDKVSVGRIVVDPNKCEGCGHCTAACTSNVRVHEEIRDFGMVTSPGCMKCMDCVSVCPNDALSFKFARPSIGIKPVDDKAAKRAKARAKNPRAYDMTWTGEIAMSLVFLVMLLGFHQFLNQIPFLMALGMAGIATFCVWLLWAMVRRPNVRLHNFQLRIKGKLRPAGAIIGFLALAYVASGAWGMAVRATLWDARWTHEKVKVPLSVTLRPEYIPSPADTELARESIAAFKRAGPPSVGGFGWYESPDALIKQSYLHLVLGEFDVAEDLLVEVIEKGEPRDELIGHLEQIMRRRGAPEAEILEMYERAHELHPRLLNPRARVANASIDAGQWERGSGLWLDALDEFPHDPNVELQAARFYMAIGDRDEALRLARMALVDARARPGTEIECAALLAQLGELEDAGRELDRIIEENPKRPSVLMRAARAAGALGRIDLTTRAMEDAAERDSETVGTLTGVGTFFVRLQGVPVERGLEMLSKASAMLATSPWELHDLGAALTSGGADPRATRMGLDLLDEAAALDPQSPVLSADLAGALFATGSTEEGIDAIRAAVERWPDDVALRGRLATMLVDAGRMDEAVTELDTFTSEVQDAVLATPIGGVLLRAGFALGDVRVIGASESVLRRALELDPTNVQTRLWLADARFALGRPAEAIQTLSDGEPEPALLASRIRARLQTGDLPGAIADAQLLPDATLSLRTFNDIGATLVDVGRQAQSADAIRLGVQLLEQAAQSAPPGLRADPLLNVAIGALVVGQTDRAIEAIEEAAALREGDPQIAQAAVAIYEQAGNAERAEHWRKVLERLGASR